MLLIFYLFELLFKLYCLLDLFYIPSQFFIQLLWTFLQQRFSNVGTDQLPLCLPRVCLLQFSMGESFKLLSSALIAIFSRFRYGRIAAETVILLLQQNIHPIWEFERIQVQFFFSLLSISTESKFPFIFSQKLQ